MAKPLSSAEKNKISQIGQELVKECRRNGKPSTIHKLPTFAAIRTRSSKIRLSRAFAKRAQAGGVPGIGFVGRKSENRWLYDLSDSGNVQGSGSRSAAAGGRTKRGFLSRLFGS